MERKNLPLLFWLLAVFLIFYFVPQDSSWFNNSVLNGTRLLSEYAKKHVLTCLIPALFIAGAISVFIKKENIMKYIGAKAKKHVAYGAASILGFILAVCSCTILPLFAGIRKKGAGLGPAITFLFAGPAINITAMFLTFSVLGYEIALARVLFAVLLSILVGLTMQLIFREKREEKEDPLIIESNELKISKKVLVPFFTFLVGILVVEGLQTTSIIKYSMLGLFILGIILIAVFKFRWHTTKNWLEETLDFTIVLLPLLFIGVFIAGFIMPLLPEALIEGIFGKNTILGNLVASVFGALMYFSTLTEIPIVQALMAKGMSNGPALALLLSGPSLSLPNMLVISKVLGIKKTTTYVSLVILYSTIAGILFGFLTS